MSKKKPIEDLMDTKPGKYFLERKKGKTKKESALSAGYADGQHTSLIENTVTYKEIVRSYKDELLDVISLREIAEAHVDNIKQDKDRGARNKAIEMAYTKLEPEQKDSREDDRLVVILR